ncbi:hypothetical protein R70723_01100 [Paenibacillus sp. FSL R7-0273]|uniref:DUF4037 domain-containing protein n=1 Tax=Paenibacillus sp. FSL R7-0273 TaxID=1536772 RepID=UPI0004F7D642|nr:DUF4037 domain-containing protein [Paenibacillus sp. FSL R7-0273]AIQ44661.1 hypothetical protein R70723_01100 [Paenibacillus sp. FSL R7-0273]OMF88269.1 hypothetical protein BK144_21955 [Paenibacillus sp. FSL R7-0273]
MDINTHVPVDRPHVTVNSLNLLPEMLKELKERLPGFAALEGVCGITLNGGCSRGYADEFSEIDLVFYLEAGQYTLWSGGQSPLPLGITRIGWYLYDIKAVSLEEELRKTWDSTALWDLSYARTLYDPEGQIAGLVRTKLAERPGRLQAEGLMFSCWWHYRLAGDIWLHRGDPVQGHAMLNTAAVQLIEALFIANREYVPHSKWLIHLSRTLPWTPAGWEEGLLKIMGTGDFSLESLSSRQAAISRYWNEIDAYLISRECPEYPLNIMHKTFYDLLNLLLAQDTLTVADWTARADLSMLSAEPFIRFTSVTGDQINIDKRKFLSIAPGDLYSWHASILSQLHTELGEG